LVALSRVSSKNIRASSAVLTCDYCYVQYTSKLRANNDYAYINFSYGFYEGN